MPLESLARHPSHDLGDWYRTYQCLWSLNGRSNGHCFYTAFGMVSLVPRRVSISPVGIDQQRPLEPSKYLGQSPWGT